MIRLLPTKDELRDAMVEKDLTLSIQFGEYLDTKEMPWENKWGIITLGPFLIQVKDGGFWYGYPTSVPNEEVRLVIGYFEGLRAELSKYSNPEIKALEGFTCSLDLV